MTTPDPGMPAGDTDRSDEPGLAAFQAEVARLFFGLPESGGFLLAGGAALLAQHLTARPTEDLDFFTAPESGHIPARPRCPRESDPEARLAHRADP
jgi:hypothetical protein